MTDCNGHDYDPGHDCDDAAFDRAHFGDITAIAALQGMLASGRYSNLSPAELAGAAWGYSDALWAEREGLTHG